MTETKDRDIVYPGQPLGEGSCQGPVFSEGGYKMSLIKGLARVNERSTNIIPLNGVYVPKPGDMVVGVVEHDFGGIYAIDIDCPYRCILRPSSGRGGRGGGRGGRDRGGRNNRDRGSRGGRDQRYEREEKTDWNLGDIVSAKIGTVDELKEAQLIGPRELKGGLVIKVKSMRVPRIIGKKKSMIEVIRKYSRSRISVGQNGLIWLKEGDVSLAVEALRIVENEAYKSGLTDKMTQFMRSRSQE